MTGTAELKSAKLAAGASKAALKEKRAKRRAENAERGGALKKFWIDGAKSSGVLAHNGVVAIAWAVPMLAVGWLALQGEFILVALVLSQTGGILMETAVDVITVYAALIVTSGFVLFFAFKLENAILRAAGRRMWRLDRASGKLDRGRLWREKHPESGD